MKNILLYGPPLAGKSTILQHFAEETSLATESFEIKPAGQSFSELAYRAVDGSTVVAQTISGAVWTMATWDELLRDEGQILLVLDPQQSRHSINQEYVEYLGARRARIAAIQVTKTDLVGEHAAEDVARNIRSQYALNARIGLSSMNDVEQLSWTIKALFRA